MWTRKPPKVMRETMYRHAIDVIRETIRGADRYGLEGLKRWDFMGLYEDTRRWSSAVLATKPGMVFAPFLNPDYIAASYAYPDDDKTGNPFHRHIIDALMPAWSEIPFAYELKVAPPPSAEAAAGADAEDLPRWRRNHRRRFYDTSLYWEDVGAPLVTEGLAQDGFWSEIYDPAKARAEWQSVADDLAVACLLPEAIRITSGA
jgi:hypothetical protein